MTRLEKTQARGVGIVAVAFLTIGSAITALFYQGVSVPSWSFHLSVFSQLLLLIATIFLAIATLVVTYQKLCKSSGSTKAAYRNELKKLKPGEFRLSYYLFAACLVAFIFAHYVPHAETPDLLTVAGDYWDVLVHGKSATVNTTLLPDAPEAQKVAMVVPMIDWENLRWWLLLIFFISLFCALWEYLVIAIELFPKHWEDFKEKMEKAKEKARAKKAAQTPAPVAVTVTPAPPPTPQPANQKQSAAAPVPAPSSPSTTVPVTGSTPIAVTASATITPQPVPQLAHEKLWVQFTKGEVAGSLVTALAFGLFHALFHEVMEQHDIRKGLVKP